MQLACIYYSINVHRLRVIEAVVIAVVTSLDLWWPLSPSQKLACSDPQPVSNKPNLPKNGGAGRQLTL
jgi:hypothetical protein